MPGATVNNLYPPKDNWRTIEEITRQVKLGRAWVQARIRAGKYQPEPRSTGQWPGRQLCYSPECQADLKRQAAELRKFRKLGSAVPLQRAATELGCTRAWIRSALRDNEGAIIRRRSPNNRLVECVTRETFRALKARRKGLAPPSHITVFGLSQLSGYRPATVAARLSQIPSERHLARDGRERPHYDIGPALQALGTKRPDEYPPGGDWMTAHRLGVLLNRSNYWIDRRLRSSRFQAARQMRRDDSNNPRWHYPPRVLTELALMSRRPNASRLASLGPAWMGRSFKN